MDFNIIDVIIGSLLLIITFYLSYKIFRFIWVVLKLFLKILFLVMIVMSVYKYMGDYISIGIQELDRFSDGRLHLCLESSLIVRIIYEKIPLISHLFQPEEFLNTSNNSWENLKLLFQTIKAFIVIN